MNRCLRSITICTLLPFSIIQGLVSCTVKEDRSVCPCILEVCFSDSDRIKGPVLLAGWAEARVFEEYIAADDCLETYTRKVPRTMISFGAVDGISDCVYDGHSAIIPAGKECDSLYAFVDRIDCTGEKALTSVVLHKQFATVNLLFPDDAVDAQEYSFIVESGSCGIDVLTCRPVEGAFRFEPELQAGGAARFRLPRQGDEALSLTVLHLPSGASVRFPLGKYISSVGYDWEAADLQDIYITLDLVRGRVSVGVSEWEETENYELTTVEL